MRSDSHAIEIGLRREPNLVELLNAAVFVLQPGTELLYRGGFEIVVKCWLIHQKPYALGRVAAIPLDDSSQNIRQPVA